FYPNCIKFKQELIDNLKEISNSWKIEENKDHKNKTYIWLHDRYIIADNKIQIILTSGIDNLMKIEKDFTYIIREL
ncbi:hypothetical protein HIY13_000819, partial [Campylobacter coli]|nr:hypothetical protein [Campylobacter coli]